MQGTLKWKREAEEGVRIRERFEDNMRLKMNRQKMWKWRPPARRRPLEAGQGKEMYSSRVSKEHSHAEMH